MLIEFMTWWAEQLQDLLPHRLSMRVRYSDAVLVRAEAGVLSLSVRRRGVETPLGVAEAGNPVIRRLRTRPPGPIVLALPGNTLLEQATTLPLAAERDLGTVLHHEMDRLTPFRAEELFWTWRLDRRDRVNGRLLLRLLLVPKRGLTPILAALDAAGLHPAAIEVTDGSGFSEHLPLATQITQRGGRRSARLAAAICAAAAALAVLAPVLRQERAIAKADSAVAALSPRVALVDGLRRRIGISSSGADLFAAERARAGNPLRAFAAVTAALPDDTYLTAFAMRDRKLTLAGRSAGAARLIASLSADPVLRNPAFDAPVTRVSDKLDLFSLRVDLSP
jgi:general secretion pathway protein L